ncbi:uncharacterized protein LOC130710717 [Lotus japonicus]|uniref:uncharacterized protein LOC130710717 n=1 Tax=Lotus japonicus TaxID=34305 RepID=UPI00258756E6|nr:uncharacterized protein LOC130710717 [Lotus japonicus]
MEVEDTNPPLTGGSLPERPSFRDKLMEGSRAEPPKEVKDLVEQGRMKIQLVNGNRLLPKIVTEASVVEEMSAPWKEALVVTLLGKSLGYRTMKLKLGNIWRLAGDFDMIDVGNGFYMIKFDRKEDREHVINGGPWMVFDHYLAVSTWSPKFISPATKVTRTLAWVRIPGLNVVFYDESYLLSIARAIGKPIKVDRNTLMAYRGRFARICVELDLTLPVVGKVCIEDYWYNIEYEGLHVICTKCGCYGHRSRECTVQTAAMTPVNPNSGTQSTIQSMVEKQTGVTDPMVAQGTSGPIQVTPETPATPDEAAMIPENSKTQSAASSPVSLAQEFEMHGDWLVVSKKKKKPHVSQGMQFGARSKGIIMGSSSSGAGSKGMSIGASMPNKSKQRSIANSSNILAGTEIKGGKAGPVMQLATKTQENKKRRFVANNNNKDIHYGPQLITGSTRTPLAPQEADHERLKMVIFGQSSKVPHEEEDYLKRFGASGCHEENNEHA